MKSRQIARRHFLALPLSLVPLGMARAATPNKPAKRSASGLNLTPRKSDLSLNVRDFGAKGDGATKDTAAMQQAIDRCWVLGGGEVVVPAGNFLTGALALRSHTILLRLEKDANIVGSPDLADYPVTEVRWEGKWIGGHLGLIYALEANHTGVGWDPGKIIASQKVGGRPTPQSFSLRRPAVTEPIGCSTDVRFEDFATEQQGVMWCPACHQLRERAQQEPDQSQQHRESRRNRNRIVQALPQ